MGGCHYDGSLHLPSLFLVSMSEATKTAAVTGERIQTVVFLRHGVARHNIIDPATGHTPSNLLDPPLVIVGKTAAVQAGFEIRTWWRLQTEQPQHANIIELIVSSPLTRCLQTATLAFLLPGDDYSEQPKHLIPLVLCKEDVREAFGMVPVDRRRQKSLLQVRVICVNGCL
jgi:hypothetical protein